MKSKYWLAYPIASILLFGIGFFTYPLVERLISNLLNNIPIVTLEKNTATKLKYLFAVTLTLIPLLTALTNFLFQMKGKYNYFVYLSMFISMLVFGGIRIYNVLQYYNEQQLKIGNSIRLEYPMENLQIISFMFIGAMIGCIAGAVLLKRVQSKNTKKIVKK